jgi:hypothetical protein
MDPVFIKGVLALILAGAVFIGSVWLLLALILGPRMGYLVMATSLFGIMVILSGMWTANSLGPKGPETTWHPAGAGSDLSEVSARGETYDVSDYPDGSGWVTPALDDVDTQELEEGAYIADLHPARSPCLSLISDCVKRDTAGETENARPVMETFVGEAVSPIPGKREAVADQVQSDIALQSGQFAIADIRMKESEVEGKSSILAVGRAVPSDQIVPDTLGAGVEEGTVEEYLVDVGDTISAGAPLIRIKSDQGTFQVPSDKTGRVLTHGLRAGDAVKAGIPLAVIDISGQPGAPAPTEVAAVRVRGAVRRPAIYYLVASLVLFGLHFALLRRAERPAVAPATAA